MGRKGGTNGGRGLLRNELDGRSLDYLSRVLSKRKGGKGSGKRKRTRIEGEKKGNDHGKRTLCAEQRISH